jgi:cytochrome c-type biogenesis protein CcsB
MFPVLWTVKGAYGAAIVLYVLALRYRTLPWATGFVVVGWLADLFLVATRGLEAMRWPSQSKFEVYNNTAMTLGAAMLGLTLAFDLTRAEGRKRIVGSLVGTVVTGFALMWLFVAGREDYDIQELPPALQSLWFPPHVTSYMLAYSAVFAAALVGALHLAFAGAAKRGGKPVGPGSLPDHLDKFVYGIVSVGFPLLTSGLFLGALWGEAAWADYWFWDIKETWAFISWLTLLGYLHLRMLPGWSGTKSSLFVVIGAAMVGVTYVGVQLLPASIASEHVYN